MQLNVVNRIWYSLVRWYPGAWRACIVRAHHRPEWAETGTAYAGAQHAIALSYCCMGAGAGCPVYAGLLLQVKGAARAWRRVTKRTKLSCACYTRGHSEENSTMSDEGSSDTTAAQDQRNSLKDVLRELLQEEPSLLAPAVEAAASRAPSNSIETKENPPGKSHTAIHVGGVPYHAAGGGEMGSATGCIWRPSRGGYRPGRQRAGGPHGSGEPSAHK